MKRIISLVLCLMLVLTSIAATVVVSNAATGNFATDPVYATLGSTYYKGWTKNSDHLNHYVKFTITQKGIVTIHATKPFDTNEYGRLEIVLYDSSNRKIADSDASYTEDDFNNYYELSVGLEPGTYMFTLKPGFYVTSGLIETYYNVSLKPTQRCEVEPNGSSSVATPLSLGMFYTGYFGSDGGNCEQYDYFKFPVTAGHTYRFTFKDFYRVSSTTTIIYAIMPGDSSEDNVGYHLRKSGGDANGDSYYEVKAKQTGTAYLYFYNYHQEQYKYELAVSDTSVGNGWYKEGSNWVCYQNGIKVTNQWMKDNKGWCYLGDDGAMVTNDWVKDSVGYCYIGAEGYIVTNRWITKDGKWYYLDGAGRKVCSQWRKDSKGWCYLDANGVMVTNGWVKDSVGWCY
ncbi:MAG: hypothetical protein IKK26_03085, partial [Clostridia bacterium]|nr:hypothetical protein [Clostridia bacterium]